MDANVKVRHGWTDLALLVGAQVAVGSAALLARLGLDGGLGPVVLAAWRLGLASIALAPIAAFCGRLRPAPAMYQKDALRLLLASGLLGLHFAAWFRSLELISVARSTLLVCTVPVWTELAGILFQRRRSSLRFWAGLAVVLVGVWLLGAGSARADRGSTSQGDFWALLGAVAMAAYLMLAEGPRERLGTSRVVGVTYPAAFIALAAWTLAFSAGPYVPASPAAWTGAVGMALVPQLLGHTGMNWALKRFTPSEVALSTLLEPGFAAALVWALMAEPLSATQAGGLCVSAGGFALLLCRR
jgi:drug/metabolite transporter (DMT)-like permease